MEPTINFLCKLWFEWQVSLQYLLLNEFDDIELHVTYTSCDVKRMYWGSRKAFYSIKFYFELDFDWVVHVLRCCTRSTMDSRIQESVFWVKAIHKVWNDQKSKSISNLHVEACGRWIEVPTWNFHANFFIEFNDFYDFSWKMKKSMISFRPRDEPSYTVSSHLINVWF